MKTLPSVSRMTGPRASPGLEPLWDRGGVFGIDLGDQPAPAQLFSGQGGGSGAPERVEDELPRLGQEIDEEGRELQREAGRVADRVGAEFGLEVRSVDGRTRSGPA